MAGHSQFANIKHRKGAQDAKRAKKFAKLARQITVATKASGDNPEFNPALRDAIASARAENMPNDRIKSAIQQGVGSTMGDHFEEIRYEGYAPGGIALIVEALTDNRNRTASDVRSLFTKFGGQLGETGSVNFMFTRVGLIQYPVAIANNDTMFEAVVEAGAENLETSDTHHTITCHPEDFRTVRDALTAKFNTPETARLAWQPNNTVEVPTLEQATKLYKLIDALEDNDDVQLVEGNYAISDAILAQLHE